MPDEGRSIATVQYQLPDPSAVTRAEDALQEAHAIVIDNHGMLEVALDERAQLVKQIAVIEAERLTITRPLDGAKRAVMDFFKKLTEPRTEAIALIDSKVRVWRHSEAQRQELEQAQAEAEVRKERDRLYAQARAAAAAGKAEEADVLTQTAAVVVAAPVAAPARVAGTVFSKTWVGEITNAPDFLRYVAEHQDRLSCIEFKQGELNALARSVKKVVPIPGFTASERESIASRG